MRARVCSQVAAQAGQYIKYKCGKGECGTCEVRVDGKWIRTCSVQVPFVEKGEVYKARAHRTNRPSPVKRRSVFLSPLALPPGLQVHVRHRMVKPGQSSRFYSFR